MHPGQTRLRTSTFLKGLRLGETSKACRCALMSTLMLEHVADEKRRQGTIWGYNGADFKVQYFGQGRQMMDTRLIPSGLYATQQIVLCF